MLIAIIGFIVAVLIYTVRNTKAKRANTVRVPLTPEERTRIYEQARQLDEDLMARQVKGLKVIESVLLREKPVGAYGQLAHKRRDAERNRRAGKLRLVTPPTRATAPEASRKARTR